MKLMNNMKNIHFFNILIPFLIIISFSKGQSIVTIEPKLHPPTPSGPFEQSILNPNKFSMNQGFTLMTSTNGSSSQTVGIYSNFSNYKIIERLQFNSGIHLIQGQNNNFYSNGNQPSLGYEFGFDYKLSQNSSISFHMSNYRNSLTRFGNNSPLNAPKK